MSRLRRLTIYGLGEVRAYVRAHGALPPADAMDEHWAEDHPLDLDVSRALECIAGWQGLAEFDDAAQAAELHRTLRLPRRVAADRMVWPWLAVGPGREYALGKYSSEDGRLNPDRVDSNIVKNAIGRLWWSADMARVDRPHEVCSALGLPPSEDPYRFLQMLFSVPTAHQELTYRNELTDRTKLVALLAFIHHERLRATEIAQLAHDASLLFSTILLDALETDLGESPYAVDPRGCAEALELLRRNLPGARAEEPRQASTTGPRRRGLLDRLLGRGE